MERSQFEMGGGDVSPKSDLLAPVVAFPCGIGGLAAIFLPILAKNEHQARQPFLFRFTCSKESSHFLSGSMGLRTLELVKSFISFQ